MLTNGIVLLAGGVGADGSPVRELEEWSFQSGVTRVVSVLLTHARENHTAYLLADGTVLLWGGSNPSEGALKYGEVFDPGTEATLTETNPPPNAGSTASPTMEIGSVGKVRAGDAYAGHPSGEWSGRVVSSERPRGCQPTAYSRKLKAKSTERNLRTGCAGAEN